MTSIEYSSDDGSETASIIADRIIGQVPFSVTAEGMEITIVSACFDCGALFTATAAGGLFVGGFVAASLLGIIILIITV